MALEFLQLLYMLHQGACEAETEKDPAAARLTKAGGVTLSKAPRNPISTEPLKQCMLSAPFRCGIMWAFWTPTPFWGLNHVLQIWVILCNPIQFDPTSLQSELRTMYLPRIPFTTNEPAFRQPKTAVPRNSGQWHDCDDANGHDNSGEFFQSKYYQTDM